MANLDFACEQFLLAQEAFKKGNFRSAERLINTYRKSVDYDKFEINDYRKLETPALSVVIVAYNTNDLLIRCLVSLRAQITESEIILVDNGGNEKVRDSFSQYPLLHIQCPINFVLSEGRNIGAHFAKSEVVAFLDDDAIASEDYVERIISLFASNENLLAFRGRVLPIEQDENINVGHYDLGEKSFPFYMNAEGNSGVRRVIYQKLFGMNPLLFGHEGTEFSYRLERKYGREKIYYVPDITIYHTFAENNAKSSAKDIRHKLMWKYAKSRHFWIKRFRKRYNQSV